MPGPCTRMVAVAMLSLAIPGCSEGVEGAEPGSGEADGSGEGVPIPDGAPMLVEVDTPFEGDVVALHVGPTGDLWVSTSDHVAFRRRDDEWVELSDGLDPVDGRDETTLLHALWADERATLAGAGGVLWTLEGERWSVAIDLWSGGGCLDPLMFSAGGDGTFTGVCRYYPHLVQFTLDDLDAWQRATVEGPGHDGVFAIAGDDVYTIGADPIGPVLARLVGPWMNPMAWSRLVLPEQADGQTLDDVWGTANGTAIAVGTGGLMLLARDGTVTSEDSGTVEDLHGIWTDGGVTYAVGEAGTVMVLATEEQWTLGAPDGLALSSVHGQAGGLTAVGGQGGYVAMVEWN